MKTRVGNAPWSRGITLIECLAYIVLLGAITGVAMVALGRLWATTGRMARSGDSLAAALRAGERWRADVRDARGPIVAMPDGTGCRIPAASGAIEWRWRDGLVWRRAMESDAVWLGPVVVSTMASEARDGVQAWRWEFLLAPESAKSRFEPWHCFVAVPGGALATK